MQCFCFPLQDFLEFSRCLGSHGRAPFVSTDSLATSSSHWRSYTPLYGTRFGPTLNAPREWNVVFILSRFQKCNILFFKSHWIPNSEVSQSRSWRAHDSTSHSCLLGGSFHCSTSNVFSAKVFWSLLFHTHVFICVYSYCNSTFYQ